MLGHWAKDASCKVIIFTMNSPIGVTHAAYLKGGTCSFPVGDVIDSINLVVPYLCKELNNCRCNDIDGKFKIYVWKNIYFNYIFPSQVKVIRYMLLTFWK